MTRLAVGIFRADLDALDSCVVTLARTEADLEALASDLTGRLAHLHEGWRGEAAHAHRAAQQRWDAAFRRLQEALAEVRAAARHAHASYLAASDANRAMWSQPG